MLHIILGILTILLTILKWLGILLLVLLLLALTLLAVVLLVPVRYRGRGEKTAEKLGAELSATWLLHLIAVEAAIDAGGGNLEIRIFGRTLDEWRALLKKVKRKKRGIGRSESSETREKKQSAEMDLSEPVKNENSEQNFTDEQTDDKQSKNLKEIQKAAQGEKAEEEQPQNEAGRLSKILARIRGFLSGLPQKVVQTFRLLKKIADGGLKAAQSIRLAVPKLIEKIRRILLQPAVFLQFWEKYEVSEVLSGVKSELFTLLSHYRPRSLTGYLKFGTEDPAQTGELTGALYLLLPTKEYEIVPNFEEAQFETETEFAGQIRSIHLLVTAYHLFRNKKLKRLIRKLRKKGE